MYPLIEAIHAKGYSSDEELKKYYKTMIMKLLQIEPTEYKKINSILNNQSFSNIMLSSDVHFLRDSEEVEERKIQSHNSMIDDSKIWVCLGDIGYKYNNNPNKLYQYVKQLNKGKYSILVLGNHDIYGKKFYHECGFDFICLGILWNDFVFSHLPISDIGKSGFRINIHGHTHDQPFEDYVNKHPTVLNQNMIDRRDFYIKVWTDSYNNYKPISLLNLLNSYFSHQIGN